MDLRRIFWMILSLVFILFTTFPFPVGAMSNDEINARVDTLLSRLSIDQKIGQIMMGFFKGPHLSPELQEMIRDFHLGGVILYTVSDNIIDVNQVTDLVSSIQQYAIDKGEVPLFVSIDQEGGLINRISGGVTVFPGNMALGAIGKEDLAHEVATITARELRILGITMNFAPVVDVNNNPLNPIIGIRSFGSQPQDVARLGTAMVPAYQDEGVVCTAKHFPGHGDVEIDTHFSLPVISSDLANLSQVELFPFRKMVENGVPAVMTAHIVVPALEKEKDLPATLSPSILSYLREKMNFRGLIITDSMGMGAICKEWGIEEASVLALQAGADILIFGADKGHEPGEQKKVFHALQKAIQTGRISVQRLDEAVWRVLTIKIKYEVCDNPFPKKSQFSQLAAAQSVQIAREVAEKSITLVKDDPGILPFSGKEIIPFIWPSDFQDRLTPLLAACPFLQAHLLPLEATPEDVSRMVEACRQSDTVVIGSYDLIRYPAWQDLIRNLPGKHVVLIAMRSPYDLLKAPQVSTYLATYGDRPVSIEALGKFLRGEILPNGHLPVELPGLYSRGWGLVSFISRPQVQK